MTKTDAAQIRDLHAQVDQLAAAMDALLAAAEPAFAAATLPPFFVPASTLAPLTQAIGEAKALRRSLKEPPLCHALWTAPPLARLYAYVARPTSCELSSTPTDQ